MTTSISRSKLGSNLGEKAKNCEGEKLDRPLFRITEKAVDVFSFFYQDGSSTLPRSTSNCIIVVKPVGLSRRLSERIIATSVMDQGNLARDHWTIL